jgi:hypothetical protein
MKKYLIIQGGTIVVSIVLALSFFMLLSVGFLDPQNTIISLILIVIGIILLAIMSILSQIQDQLGRSKK